MSRPHAASPRPVRTHWIGRGLMEAGGGGEWVEWIGRGWMVGWWERTDGLEVRRPLLGISSLSQFRPTRSMHLSLSPSLTLLSLSLSPSLSTAQGHLVLRTFKHCPTSKHIFNFLLRCKTVRPTELKLGGEHT